mgnify:FL=1
MNPEYSRCLSIFELGETYVKWVKDFDKFKQDASLSKNERERGAIGAFKKQLSLLRDLDKLADIKTHKELISDSEKFLADFKNGKLNQATIDQILETGPKRLNSALLDDLTQAPKLNNCDVNAPGLFSGRKAKEAPATSK